MTVIAPTSCKQTKRSTRYQPRPASQHPVEIVDSYHTPFSTLDVRGQVFYMVPHGAKFVVKVHNPFPYEKCSFNLQIDGISMGSWVLKPNAVGYFERPVKVSQCFTFLSTPLVARAEEAADMVESHAAAIFDLQVQQALFSAPLGTGITQDNPQNGQVTCTFTPELRNETCHRRISVDKTSFRKMRKSAATSELCQESEKIIKKEITPKLAPRAPGYAKSASSGCDLSVKNDRHCRFSTEVRPSSARERQEMHIDTRPQSPIASSSSSTTAKASSEKKSIRQRARSHSAHTSPALSSCFPSSSQQTTLTPGASTLQGHSSQVFGRTSLQKDPSRAVSVTVSLMASVPIPTPPMSVHMPIQYFAPPHAPVFNYNKSRTVPLAVAEKVQV